MEWTQEYGTAVVTAGEQLRLDLDGVVLSPELPEIKIDGTPCRLDWQEVETDGRERRFAAADAAGRWEWRLTRCANSDGVPGWRLTLSGTLTRPVRSLGIVPLRLVDVAARRVLTQGVSMGDSAGFAVKEAACDFSSHYQLMLVHPDGACLQLTVPQQSAYPARFCGVAADGRITRLQAEVECLHFGECRIEAVPVEVYAAPDGFALMEAYATKECEIPRVFDPAPVCGWNSWDYYRWTITEEEVLKNAEFIARDPVLAKRVRRIIVDDGWAYCYGEWDANPRFPGGMAKLARELTRMGFEPGLWFAPAIVEPHARIAQLDYDMLARGENGWPCLGFECMRRYGFLLDPTVEKSRRFLRELFDRYARMGYKYFKLDFLGQALAAPRFADASVPRSRIVRQIVAAVHEGVAGRAQLLGCNYHFEAGSRYVDAVRVASDIHARWDSFRRNTVSVAARFWCNRRWWLNDPDFAICRSPETSDDPDLERLLACLVFVTPDGRCAEETPDFRLVDRMGEEQIEMLLSIVLCAAGAITFSDDMTRLNPVGLALAHRVAEAEPGETARPLDLFEHDLPERWLQKTPSGWRLLLANWSETATQTFTVDPAALGIAAHTVCDFWHPDRTTGWDPCSKRLTATLAPRSCRFLELK